MQTPESHRDIAKDVQAWLERLAGQDAVKLYTRAHAVRQEMECSPRWMDHATKGARELGRAQADAIERYLEDLWT